MTVGRMHRLRTQWGRADANRIGKSRAVVEYKEYAGRPHFPTAPGWEAVADYALEWTIRHADVAALPEKLAGP